MKNGEDYCRLIREQIETLLEKAHLGDDERTILHQLNAKKITADLLDAYDAEYERLSQLYQRRQPVLDAFDKWNSFWNEYVAFTVRLSLIDVFVHWKDFRKPRRIPDVSMFVDTTPKSKDANERNSNGISRRSNRSFCKS